MRYSTAARTIVPDAGRDAFSEDDILELKKVIEEFSSTAEWADIKRAWDSRGVGRFAIPSPPST